MTAREYAGWRVYYGFEPFGPEMEDQQWAHTRYMMASIAGSDKNRRLTPATFQLFWSPEKEKSRKPASAEELKQKLMALAEAQNNGGSR